MTDMAIAPPLDDTAGLDLERAPVVGRAREGGLPTPVVAVIFVVVAIILFLILNGRRNEAEAQSLVTPTADLPPSEPAPPLQLPAVAAPAPAAVAAPIAAPPPPPVAAAPPPPPAGPSASDILQRRRAPAVVVDLGASSRPIVLAQASPASLAAAATAPAQTQAQPTAITEGSLEALASRLTGATTSADTAVALPRGNLDLMIPQGAVIPAVLETAINSDLPGYTRAIVSLDVRSFDGRTVLIPRGSRLIGQYRSAISMGQSRAFVVWSRVTRPDGVSVQIGSPGTDELGRAGLTGEIDRHFFSRFAGSILLSVLNAGVAAVGTPTTTIAIGSPGQAAGAAQSAQMGENIPPTIKVAQGEAIRIFVARDLDFSAVGPVR